MALVIWTVQDAAGAPIQNATVAGASATHGNWQMATDCAGHAITQLAAGTYDMRFSASGFTTRTYPATVADAGIITTGLERASGPFLPAPREWRGQMCGLRIGGLPAVPGGAADASLFLSWFYDRYDVVTRGAIRTAMKTMGYAHWLLSWPDSRSQGATIESFRETCAELILDGFFPCVMLCSKDFDPADVPAILAEVTPLLDQLVGLVPMFCIGWELSLWLSPTQVQELIDAITPITLTQAGTLNYVHFQVGYFAFQQPGGTTADFWKLQVGKLTGVLHQRDPNEDKGNQGEYQARLTDCLQRFAGQFNFPTDSGFGHPFDIVALEITASQQFNGTMSEATGNSWGRAAVNTPPVNGVKVMGSGNGL